MGLPHVFLLPLLTKSGTTTINTTTTSTTWKGRKERKGKEGRRKEAKKNGKINRKEKEIKGCLNRTLEMFGGTLHSDPTLRPNWQNHCIKWSWLTFTSMQKSATHNHLSWLLLFFLTQLHLTWQQGVKPKGMFAARAWSVTLRMIFLHHHQSRISDSLVLHVSKGQQQLVHEHLYIKTLCFTMTVLRYRVSFDTTLWLAGDPGIALYLGWGST